MKNCTKTIALITAVVLMISAFASCSLFGGGSDADKIKSRIEEYVDYIDDGDSEGIMSCLDSSFKDDYDTYKSALDSQADTIKAADVSIEYMGEPVIDGNNATIEVTLNIGLDGLTNPKRYNLKLVKEDGDWYLCRTDGLL